MFKIVYDVLSVVTLRGLADRHHPLEKRGSERTSLVAYHVETTECRVAYRDCRVKAREKQSRKGKTGQTQETNKLRQERRFPYHMCRAWSREKF